MEFQALTMTATLLLCLCYHQQCGLFRGLFLPAKAFLFILVLSCTFFYLATCEPCSTSGMEKSADYNACGSYGDKQQVVQAVIGDDSDSGYIAGSSMIYPNSESVCTDLNLLCFPSTLPGFISKVHNLKTDALEISNLQSGSPLSIEANQANSGASNGTWLSQSSMFKLLNGRTISCSFSSEESTGALSSIGSDVGNHNSFSSCRQTLPNQKSRNISLKKNIDLSKPGSFDVSFSPKVAITPPVLDWGQKYLFSPSVAFLTVANSFSDSMLHIYEPFSTSSQFYPCNSSEVLLGPGEVASICIVFLPRWLGLSTARLILQTSSGGFLVPTKGFGVESPYKILPLVGLDVLSSGRLSKNISVFNPYSETLHVAYVTSWISVSVGNTTYHTEASCNIENFQNDKLSLLSVDDWLVVRNGQAGIPLMAMRPHRNWEIGPHDSEIIMEMDFPLGLEGKIFGAFCMKLLRSAHNMSDTVLVPLEVDLDSEFVYDNLTGHVSVFLEPLVSCDARGNAVAVSLRNGASCMINVVRICEVAERKIFQIKYMEGLLLFPGTVTQVAVITCTQLAVELHNSLPEVSNINGNCKLLILTNDSSSSQIEIPCQDVIHVCSRHQVDSFKNVHRNVEASNTRIGSVDGDGKVPSDIKELETVEADELVLGNWKSQGTTSGMSVLDDHEVLFPMVQIGSHCSEWITVKNPSHQPVVMQVILNSGEIIDECRDADGFLEPPSSGSLVDGKSTRPTRYGFSIAESALTEAYVHPHGRASFGPIFFHPSNRCAWRSSALIRNNLSGVEWLSLRGFGGSLSLVLFEGSEPIESVEFNLSLPVLLNIIPDTLFRKEETTSACSQPLSKELYAMNTGDLPLEVRSIEVSGAGCRLDGFMVHSCNGFSLEPGESTKVLISYQTDFSAAIVHRDLELALATGIFVIPMKASLPVFMFNICKKSIFWMRLKKLSMAVLAVSLMFLVFCCLYLQIYPYGQNKTSVKEMTAQHAKLTLENHGQSNSYVDTQKEEALPFLSSKSLVAETSDTVEASHPDNLTVRVGKEKGRKRRKRKGAAAVLSGLREVSSSQSGNSTPSSPLSPVITSIPNRATCLLSPELDQPNGSRYLFSLLADGHSEKGPVPEPEAETKLVDPHVPVSYHNNNQYSTPMQLAEHRKTASKSVLLPSHTFPSAGKTALSLLCSSPSLASASTIAPHARAPGSKLYQKTTKREQAGLRDAYTYDIWGDPFSVNNTATKNDSSSFFVSGPQTLLRNSQSRSAHITYPIRHFVFSTEPFLDVVLAPLLAGLTCYISIFLSSAADHLLFKHHSGQIENSNLIANHTSELSVSVHANAGKKGDGTDFIKRH